MNKGITNRRAHAALSITPTNITLIYLKNKKPKQTLKYPQVDASHTHYKLHSHKNTHAHAQ